MRKTTPIHLIIILILLWLIIYVIPMFYYSKPFGSTDIYVNIYQIKLIQNQSSLSLYNEQFSDTSIENSGPSYPPGIRIVGLFLFEMASINIFYILIYCSIFIMLINILTFFIFFHSISNNMKSSLFGIILFLLTPMIVLRFSMFVSSVLSYFMFIILLLIYFDFKNTFKQKRIFLFILFFFTLIVTHRSTTIFFFFLFPIIILVHNIIKFQIKNFIFLIILNLTFFISLNLYPVLLSSYMEFFSKLILILEQNGILDNKIIYNIIFGTFIEFNLSAFLLFMFFQIIIFISIPFIFRGLKKFSFSIVILLPRYLEYSYMTLFLLSNPLLLFFTTFIKQKQFKKELVLLFITICLLTLISLSSADSVSPTSIRELYFLPFIFSLTGGIGFNNILLLNKNIYRKIIKWFSVFSLVILLIISTVGSWYYLPLITIEKNEEQLSIWLRINLDETDQLYGMAYTTMYVVESNKNELIINNLINSSSFYYESKDIYIGYKNNYTKNYIDSFYFISSYRIENTINLNENIIGYYNLYNSNACKIHYINSNIL